MRRERGATSKEMLASCACGDALLDGGEQGSTQPIAHSARDGGNGKHDNTCCTRNDNATSRHYYFSPRSLQAARVNLYIPALYAASHRVSLVSASNAASQRRPSARQPAALHLLARAGVSAGQSAKPSIPPSYPSTDPARAPNNICSHPLPSSHHSTPSPSTPHRYASSPLRALRLCVPSRAYQSNPNHTCRSKGWRSICDRRASASLLLSTSFDNAPLAFYLANPHHRLATAIIRGLSIDLQMAP
jgi:hypothetical protein